jgi:aminobenzoyl-glutamate utilization protein B
MNYKSYVNEKIEDKRDVFTSLSDRIWDYAELSLKEYKSAKDYIQTLKSLGFETKEKICGLDTAFSGEFGTGRPIIAILGEFDALSGLSQEGNCAEKKPLIEGGCGHGCGHNMLGAGALAAAYGIKCYLEKSKKSGTVIFYGTPGEEGGAGKAYMAKCGLFYNVDAALTWHPMDINEVSTGSCNSTVQILYKFKGTASHAAGDPENGRSALDALEIMNIGVQFLREHTKDDARIHYSIIDGGGASPNVVQPTASVLYMIRSNHVRDVNALALRVDKCAKGAALMTETEYERVFIDGCSTTVPNHTLESVLFKNLEACGKIEYSQAEWEFADNLKSTYKPAECITMGASHDKNIRKYVNQMSENGKRALNDFIVPLYQGEHFSPGSTDVGDVSWQTPTAQVYLTCFAAGSPGHSWQNVSIGKSSIGHKGLIHAGKILANTAIDLYENPDIIKAAKEELLLETNDEFVSPIPDGETIKAL